MKKWTHREWMACGVLLFSVSGLLWWLTLSSTQHGLVIDQVYVLGNGEGSFAYSRISPNGRLLAYTSLRFDGPDGTAKYTVVVDLEDGKKIFEEKGLDGYWSPNGRELIFLDQSESDDSVSILDTYTGRVKRDVAPPALGDYFSWGIDGGRNIIATNKNNYYYFEDGKAVLPASHIVPCGWSGAADGPFISKDGRRMAGFEGRAIVVRNLDDCEDIIRTGMEGGKADFSYDGRYIAFHAPKAADPGYEIKVVDLAARTVRTIAGLPGSSFYPSWTIDARLSFRYDAADFRGFVIASNFMSEPAEPLPVGAGMAAQAGELSYAFLHFPLQRIHPEAVAAAAAAECAGQQGRFWEMHDWLFANQAMIGAVDYLSQAHGTGADEAALDACMLGEGAAGAVEAEFRLGVELGVRATPTFFIGRAGADGVVELTRRITGQVTLEDIEEVLAEEGGGWASWLPWRR